MVEPRLDCFVCERAVCPQLQKSGDGSIQSNLVRPVPLPCAHCETVMAVTTEAPSIRLLA